MPKEGEKWREATYQGESISEINKSFSGKVYLTKEFPRSIEDLSPIFQVCPAPKSSPCASQLLI